MPKASSFTRAEIDQTVILLRKIKTMPPRKRARLLEGMREYGPRVRELLAIANREVRRAERRGCSMPVIDAVTDFGERPVVRGMSRSRARTRIGDAAGTYPSRRLTPRNAVRMEDRYDVMTTFEATICADPPSISGLQFQQLAEMRGREKSQPRNKAAKSRKNANRTVKTGSGKH